MQLPPHTYDEIVVQLYPDIFAICLLKEYDTMEFDMSDERIRLLIQAGKEAIAAYLSR